MTQYYLPDLSGTSTDYLKINLPVSIFRNGQKVFFKNSPIHANSLRIALTDGTEYVLQKDVDYSYTNDDLDDDAMSIAFTEDPDFTGTLLRSVTVTSSRALGRKCAMSYQQFFLTTPNTTFDNGQPIEVTPDLIKTLVVGLADCRQQLARVTSPIAPIDAPPALLPFDVNGTLPGNAVVGEAVAVNTVIGGKFIRLAKGAYFADSLALSYNGQALSPSTDFLPVGVSALTDRTTNPSGIYQYILLNGTFTGTVSVNYHAVGGDIQVEDVQSIYDLMTSITNFLNTGVFITAQTIPETPSFRAFNARLNSLETNVRNLLTGTPTYGDATGGSSVLRAVQTTDAKHHWWTIATLFKVQGSSDIITADRFRGRVYFPGSKVSVGFTVDVNLNQTRDPVSFTTESLVFDPTYTLFSDLSVAAPVYPLLRVVWNQTGQAFSGACLQIGLPVPALNDQMTVEDLSSTQSCWLLDKTGAFVTGAQQISPQAPKDTGFLLPDGASTWSNSSNVSLSKIYVPKFEDGYLAYTGSTVALTQLTSDASTGSLFVSRLPISFPVTSIKQVVVTMASADASTVYDVVVPVTTTTPLSKTGRASFVDSVKDILMMRATLSQDVNGVYTISLNVSATTATDVVRYVRVRV